MDREAGGNQYALLITPRPTELVIQKYKFTIMVVILLAAGRPGCPQEGGQQRCLPEKANHYAQLILQAYKPPTKNFSPESPPKTRGISLNLSADWRPFGGEVSGCCRRLYIFYSYKLTNISDVRLQELPMRVRNTPRSVYLVIS